MPTLTIAGPVSGGGSPLWLQKLKVRGAKRRHAPLRLLRCWMGWHNPPFDDFFEEYASVHIGGACDRCGDPTVRVVVWVGDVWHFRSLYSKAKLTGDENFTVDNLPIEVLLSAHLAYLLGEETSEFVNTDAPTAPST